MKRSLAFLGLALGLAVSLRVSVSAARFPGEVFSAEQSIVTWLNGLNGKSLTQVETELGPPTERTTWSFMGGAPPLLRYTTPGDGRLELYFAAGKVVKVSYQLMSE